MNRRTLTGSGMALLALCLVVTGWLNAQDMKACRQLHSEGYCNAEVLR